jgi:hypothetical protein
MGYPRLLRISATLATAVVLTAMTASRKPASAEGDFADCIRLYLQTEEPQASDPVRVERLTRLFQDLDGSDREISDSDKTDLVSPDGIVAARDSAPDLFESALKKLSPGERDALKNKLSVALAKGESTDELLAIVDAAVPEKAPKSFLRKLRNAALGALVVSACKGIYYLLERQETIERMEQNPLPEGWDPDRYRIEEFKDRVRVFKAEQGKCPDLSSQEWQEIEKSFRNKPDAEYLAPYERSNPPQAPKTSDSEREKRWKDAEQSCENGTLR